MKIKFLLFSILSLCFSCNQQEETGYQLPNLQPKIVKAIGYVVPKDSMAPPNVIKINKNNLKAVKAGKPKVVATNTNIHKAGKPKIVKAGKPRIIKIGFDNFLMPKKVKATGKVVRCKMPKPVKAGLPVMKDNATCNIQYLDVDQGMNSSYVQCMLQDKFGNLWFGTDGGGVTRYNGESFIHFTEEQGLSNNTVWSILEDKTGNLWFGTSSGISKYDGDSFTHFNEKQGINNNIVYCILEDTKGNLWFGTDGGGVSKYEPSNKEGKVGTFTHFTEKQGLSSNIILCLLEDKSGNLWFGTDGGGVSKYQPLTNNDQGGTFTNFTEKEGLGNKSVCSILEDKKGNFWFGTDGGGVIKYEPSIKEGQHGTFTHFTEKEGLSNNSIKVLKKDKMENIWLGTSGGGVSKFEPSTKEGGIGTFTHFTKNEGLSDNIILSILEDKTGTLWFGSFGGGVCKYDRASFTHYTDREGLSKGSVLSILEDKMGKLWLGKTSGGVSIYDGASFSHFTEQEGLINNFVFCIIQDKKGNLWIGSAGGVSKLTVGESCKQYNFTHFTENEGLSNNLISSIIEDKLGNIWFGTYYGGISKLTISEVEGETQYSLINFTEKQGLSNDRILSILEDKKGNLWIGTDGGGVSKLSLIEVEGVIRYNFTHFTQKQGLGNNIINSILEDKTGNLWFGTNGGGVSKYTPSKYKDNMGTLTNFTEKQGLGNNNVLSIIEDKNISGEKIHLYIATEKGLTNLVIGASDSPNNIINEKKAEKKSFNNVSFKWLTFKKADGLKAEDFYGSTIIDSKGFAWWGSGKALTRINIKDFKYPINPPQLQMNDLAINENYIDYRNLNDSVKNSLKLYGIDFNKVKQFYNYPLNLILPYRLNHLTFNFSAIDWQAPHKLKYQYKIIGLDKTWSELTSENKADYRNIPFGTFTFKVRAIGVAGKWSNTFDYSFVIHPPWWRTWWAYSLYFTTVISCIFYYIKWREKLLKQRQLELEQTVDERTYELVEEKKLVEHQKEIVEEKQKEILDSIEYAKRIQATILPSVRVVKKYLEDSFILYLPKDIVAGDFYWMESIQLADELISGLANEKSVVNNQRINTSANQLIYFAACDCTGHGVPGAMVSVVCHNALNKALKEFGKRTPAEILDKVAELVIDDFNKNAEDNDEIKDGMDASLFALDTDTGRLQWAGANNPLWLIRKGQALEETKADKQPVGRSDERYPYTNHEFQLEKGDVIYLITDGYADQFGGEKNRKFQKKQLKELLFSMHHLPMDVQRNKLYEAFINWRGENEQVDDVCIIGVRI
jgi:ligand-binding sensor domain-containing protein/serine phosphatase RsbU (regulator of sigma subunit)